MALVESLMQTQEQFIPFHLYFCTPRYGVWGVVRALPRGVVSTPGGPSLVPPSSPDPEPDQQKNEVQLMPVCLYFSNRLKWAVGCCLGAPRGVIRPPGRHFGAPQLALFKKQRIPVYSFLSKSYPRGHKLDYSAVPCTNAPSPTPPQ